MKTEVIKKLAQQLPVSTGTRSIDTDATPKQRTTGGTSKTKGCGCGKKK